MSLFVRAIPLFLFLFSLPVFSATKFSQQARGIKKVQLKDEAIISLKTRGQVLSAEDLHLEASFREPRKLIENSSWEVLTSRPEGSEFRTLILWKEESTSALKATSRRLEALPQVEWIRPNYQYEGEAREFYTPDDPLFGRQRHHDIIQSPLAWMLSLGSQEVIVAVTDDGVDIDHEDLAPSIWINPHEIPDNDLDDDFNGYVDDVNGWDFSSGDNNPRPVSSWSGGDHGTHVAGIIAAANNSVGLIGVSPQIKIMPIRFYGSNTWTSAIIAKSYAYAVDNGARIITTSYNIDYMVNDPVFQEAIAYVYSKGAMHFNSAGNNNALNPKRQQIDELILVCSTEVREGLEDVKSGFSNYGRGVDICAPGSDIWSSVPGNDYSSMSGTSMAAPMAAGVAALIWSVHPHWSRDQVAARLFQSSENIDEKNSSWIGYLGAGRVNAFAGVTFKHRPPQFSKVELDSLGGKVRALRVATRDIFSESSFESERLWSLLHEDGEEVALEMSRPYKLGTNEIVLELSESLRAGNYELRLFAEAWRDPFGQSLDGDSDDLPGGDFVYGFSIEERGED